MLKKKTKKSNAQMIKDISALDNQLRAEGKRPILTQKCKEFFDDLIEKYGDQDDDIFNLKLNKGLRSPEE